MYKIRRAYTYIYYYANLILSTYNYYRLYYNIPEKIKNNHP